MAASDFAYPMDDQASLFVLTHYRLEAVTLERTAAQTFEAWQQWRDAAGQNARVYSPFECAQEDLSKSRIGEAN